MRQNKPERQTQVVDLDYKDLWFELKIIKENHLKHLHEDVEDVKTELKETRKEFNTKIDRLDNRIWWLVGLVTVTMIGVIAEMVVA
jgi:hypothetical protein